MEARRKGCRVKEVVFEESGHCAHFLMHREMYTGALRGMWQRSDGGLKKIDLGSELNADSGL